MTRAGAWKGASIIVALLFSSGCYSYVPTDISLATPGDNVRVLVTRVGAAELDEISPDAVSAGTIAGIMDAVEDDQLLLRVNVGERREGFAMLDLRQTIRVPMGEILSMEAREFNGVGTGLLVAGGAAVATLVVIGIIEAFGGADTPDDGEPPEDFSVVFGRFSFPWGM